MVYTLSYQLYKYEHGLTAAEQRSADVRAGEAAAALRTCGSAWGVSSAPGTACGRPAGRRTR
jgi:hypothetical protein